jgi:hypothetical protein
MFPPFAYSSRSFPQLVPLVAAVDRPETKSGLMNSLLFFARGSARRPTVGLRANFTHRNCSIISQGQDIEAENRDNPFATVALGQLSTANSGSPLGNVFTDSATKSQAKSWQRPESHKLNTSSSLPRV